MIAAKSVVLACHGEGSSGVLARLKLSDLHQDPACRSIGASVTMHDPRCFFDISSLRSWSDLRSLLFGTQTTDTYLYKITLDWPPLLAH